MPVTVVVGGQFGSEGKGKTTNYLAGISEAPLVVRCGGPNSGHTIYRAGKPLILRQVPCGVLNPSASLLIAAGAIIDEEVLQSEIVACELSPERLGIDSNAMVISADDKGREARTGLGDRISSTLTGTGAATARKVLREQGLRLARDLETLRAYP